MRRKKSLVNGLDIKVLQRPWNTFCGNVFEPVSKRTIPVNNQWEKFTRSRARQSMRPRNPVITATEGWHEKKQPKSEEEPTEVQMLSQMAAGVACESGPLLAEGRWKRFIELACV